MFRRIFAPRLTLSRPLSVRRDAGRALRFESLEPRALLTATAAGDFNGDGRADFATGVPYEDLHVGASEAIDAGVVQVLYGTATGLDSPGNQLWSQNSPNVGDSVEGGEHFGWAVAAGDFNGDGFEDLAVSAPSEDVNGHSGAGLVHILYGSAGGLVSPTTPGADVIHQDKPGMLDSVEDGDFWGWTLAAGDFDGDGHDDLAVGAQFETVNGHVQGGLVQVVYGSSAGISATGNQVWQQDKPNMADSVEDFDNFGAALAAGDFDGDGDDELAIGAPVDGIIGADDVGTVTILEGGPGGLTASLEEFWHQNRPGIHDSVQAGDFFGAALAAGDYNGDGRNDLVIGVPNEELSFVNAGAIHVLYGTTGGLTSAGTTFLHQDSPGVLDSSEGGDQFGLSLQTGDFNGDGRDDVAVGSPFESLGPGNGLEQAGAVHLFYGGASGITATGNQLWQQNSPAILDSAEEDDLFGYYLAAGDFDGDGRDDLAIDVPSEDLGQGNVIQNAGGVNVIYGTSAGLDSPRNQFWHQNSPAVLDSDERGDGWPTNDAFVPASAAASTWWITAADVAAPTTTKLGRSRVL